MMVYATASQRVSSVFWSFKCFGSVWCEFLRLILPRSLPLAWSRARLPFIVVVFVASMAIAVKMFHLLAAACQDVSSLGRWPLFLACKSC